MVSTNTISKDASGNSVVLLEPAILSEVSLLPSGERYQIEVDISIKMSVFHHFALFLFSVLKN